LEKDCDDQRGAPGAEGNGPQNKRYWIALAGALVALWIAFGVITAQSIKKTDGRLVYALDDAYISMAIAKNLAQHGTWGVRADQFTSSASSVLWILLLAAAYGCIGVHAWIPLAMNVFFASALAITVWAILKSFRVGPLVCLVSLLLLIFWFPVVPIAFTGLEHILQAWIAVAFAYTAGQTLADGVSPKTQAAGLKLLLLLAPLVTLVRYEGLFLLAIVGLLCLIRRKIIAGVLVVGVGSLPVAVGGLVFMWKGWFFLPASVVLKGSTYAMDVVHWRGILGYLWAGLACCASTRHIALLLGTVCAILVFSDRKTWWSRGGVLAMVFLATTWMHVQFAGLRRFVKFDGNMPEFAALGWVRYESYLVCLGVIVVVVLLRELALRRGLSWRSVTPRFGPSWARFAALAVPLVLLSYPLTARAIRAHSQTAQASVNNYQQQYQMGLFLQKYWPGAVVAANDIGAINFLADIRCLDLMGLADIDVARLRVANLFDSAQVQRITQEKGVDIAIVYDCWFKQPCALPPHWIKIGQWTIPNNVVCADSTVTFYAVDSQKAARLHDNMQDFLGRLPRGAVASLTPAPTGERLSKLPQESALPQR
jgi:hypothetical protein